MSLRLFGIFICGFILQGCSSWSLKQKCESTNWFEYSQSLAFTGKYLEEDSFVKSCKSVDRISSQQIDLGFKLGREKMCQYSEIFQRGRDGTPVFFKFCDGLELTVMQSEFQRGLKEFCTEPSGYKYGKSGKVYLKVCSAQQEVKFLPPYENGRAEYLLSFAESLNSQSTELGSQLSSLVASEQLASREYQNLPSPQDCQMQNVYNPTTKQDESKQICKESYYIQQQREGLFSQLSSLRSQISSVRGQISKNLSDRLQTQKDFAALSLTAQTLAYKKKLL